MKDGKFTFTIMIAMEYGKVNYYDDVDISFEFYNSLGQIEKDFWIQSISEYAHTQGTDNYKELSFAIRNISAKSFSPSEIKASQDGKVERALVLVADIDMGPVYLDRGELRFKNFRLEK